MERLRLHFCPDDIELNLDGLDFEIAEIKKTDNGYVRTPGDILNEAILKGDIDIEEFSREASSILVIVNDRQRPTPTSFILPYLRPILEREPYFIVACGAHEPPNVNELKAIFGQLYEKIIDRVHIHRAKEDKTVKVLSSRWGFDFELNAIIEKFDSIVMINSIEPHYFAGFTGGRKSFLPGISSYETIRENHKYSLHPGSMTFALEGNPVHENMMELAQYMERLKQIYSVQVVLDSEGNIYSAYAGSLEYTFRNAVNDARKLYGVPIEKKAHIVITVASSPQDSRLYQSFKALDNGAVGLDDNGILMLVASCHDGVGNKDFLENVSRFKSPDDVLKSPEFSFEKYKLGYQRILRLARWGANGNLWIVTNMNKDEAEKLFFKPFDNLNKAIELALSIKGKNARILIIPNGILTVP